MTSQERVMRLLAEANPIPDVDALERSATFRGADTAVDTAPEAAFRSQRKHVRLAIAAALIVLSLALIVWFGNRPTSVDPVDTGPEPTATVTAEPIQSPTPESTAETAPTPEPASPSLVSESLTGRWDGFSFSLLFEPPRYAVIANELAIDSGTYIFEGGELTLSSDASSGSCPAGSEARFAVNFTDGALELEPTLDDECGFDRGIGVGSKSLTSGQATPIPPSVLDVARPLAQLSGPGVYVADRFAPSFSVVLPPGWRFHASSVPPAIDFTTSINDNTALLVWYRHEVNTTDEVYELFATTPGVEAGDPAPASISGFDGVTFDYLQTETNTLLIVPGIPAGNIVAPPDNMWRAWALDVDGVVVTIVATTTPGTFSEKSAEIEEILDSITWDSQGLPPVGAPNDE